MRFAMVFPGQGSQSVGMLAELARTYPEVETTFATASRALGLDLWALVQQGPESELGRTERTQPAMLAAGVAVWRAWQAAGGPAPAVMAGHSLGEYTALVCAGALAFEEAVTLVAERGRLMQEAVPPGEGAMAAVLGLSDEQVAQACEQAAQGEVVTPANYNSPGQVVVAGAAAAVGRAVELARAAGAKRAVLLAVSVPSHCPLMRPAAERLAERLARTRLATPAIPVIHNVDAAARESAEGIREALVAQLHRPVRWTDCVRAMAGEGARFALEAGPGKVLTGLARRIAPAVEARGIADPQDLGSALAAVRE